MQQQQNRGNQGAGMSDPDPPDEIYDSESPSHGNVYAPNSHTDGEEYGYRVEEHQQQQKRNAESQEPARASALAKNDRADLVGYGRNRVAGLDHPWLADFGRAFERIRFHVDCPGGAMNSDFVRRSKCGRV